MPKVRLDRDYLMAGEQNVNNTPRLGKPLQQRPQGIGEQLKSGALDETPAARTQDDMLAELAALKAEKAELEARLAQNKAAAARAIYMKVSEKGGASLYGLGRFPITLYVEQWGTVLDMADDIRAFLEEHKAALKTKAQANAQS